MHRTITNHHEPLYLGYVLFFLTNQHHDGSGLLRHAFSWTFELEENIRKHEPDK